MAVLDTVHGPASPDATAPGSPKPRGLVDTAREKLRRNRWWIGRVLVVPLHLLLFTVVTFLLIRSVPGDPVLMLLGDNWSPEDYERMEAALGLDGSMLEQLIAYLGGVVTLDLGESIVSGRAVLDELLLRLPQTLELAVISLVCTVIVGLLASYLVVMHPKNVFATIIRTYSRAAGAIPEYVLAVAALFVFYAVLRWAPAPLGRLDSGISQPPVVSGFPLIDAVAQGRLDAAGSIIAHLVLPVVVMTLAQSALLVKILTVSLEEALDAAPTRFRIASGAGRFHVVTSIYRRALPPAITMCGTLFGYLMGGAIIIESLFGFSGMGQYAVDAVASNDYVALQGFLLLVAGMSLLLFLLVDITNMLIDPRRRPGVRTEDA